MEDFNALASSLALGVRDVRGCLILSRDGLVLGAHPTEAESTTTPAWVRFATLGDPERGFAQFGTETWCYVRRGPYAGFALVGPGARPGLVIDHMDQVLLAAEEGRSRHEGLRGVEGAAVAPQSKPRSHLHTEHPTSDPLVIDAPAPVVVPSSSGRTSDGLPPLPSSASEPVDVPAGDGPETVEPRPDAFARFLGWEAGEPAAGSPARAPESEPSAWADAGPVEGEHEPHHHTEEAREASMNDPRDEAGEGAEDAPNETTDPEGEAGDQTDDVDRFSLAREFGQLLQGGEDPADG